MNSMVYFCLFSVFTIFCWPSFSAYFSEEKLSGNGAWYFVEACMLSDQGTSYCEVSEHEEYAAQCHQQNMQHTVVYPLQHDEDYALHLAKAGYIKRCSPYIVKLSSSGMLYLPGVIYSNSVLIESPIDQPPFDLEYDNQNPSVKDGQIAKRERGTGECSDSKVCAQMAKRAVKEWSTKGSHKKPKNGSIKKSSKAKNREIRNHKNPGRLPLASTSILKGWIEENLKYPYPSAEEKEALAKIAGLAYFQVDYWFMNRRQRDPRLEGCKKKWTPDSNS